MFSFVEKFYSNKDIEQALPQLQDAITKKLSVKQCRIENDRLCFTIKQQDVLAYNSFLPKVEICAKKSGTSTQLHVQYTLQSFVQVFMLIYFSMAGLLELLVIGLLFADSLSSPLLLLLPVGIAALACLLAWAGLHFSAKPVTKIISDDGWKASP